MERVDVDGVRRFAGLSQDEISDDEIRLALVRLSLETDPNRSDEEVAAGVRRFAAAMERARIV